MFVYEQNFEPPLCVSSVDFTGSAAFYKPLGASLLCYSVGRTFAVPSVVRTTYNGRLYLVHAFGQDRNSMTYTIEILF